MLLTAFLLAALQDPVPAPAPVADGIPRAETALYPSGVEAPAQPTGRSSATVRRTERYAPAVAGDVRSKLLAPVSSLVAVRGQETNVVSGIGLVTGLAGTGDSIEGARQLLKNLLLTRNINLDLGALSSKNIAIVQVEAEVPAGIKPGRRVDVRVSTVGDASSLLGGVLTLTELTDITGTVVYATAAGPVSVGGFQVEGQGASATRNHPTVGTLPGGGKVEREIQTSIASEHGYIYLDLRSNQDMLGNVVRITDAINALYPGAAAAQPDGKTVRVRVPEDLQEEDHVAYLQSLLSLEIESEDLARVVINERTGVIVMGGDVRLRPGAVAQGNLTVTIAESPEASQPGPLSAGRTQRLDRTELGVEEEDNALVLIPGAVTLKEVVEVLNVLGATPRDLINILDAMSQGGLLVAEIRRL
jgi:flagellar P-ring protein FlgI